MINFFYKMWKCNVYVKRCQFICSCIGKEQSTKVRYGFTCPYLKKRITSKRSKTEERRHLISWTVLNPKYKWDYDITKLITYCGGAVGNFKLTEMTPHQSPLIVTWFGNNMFSCTALVDLICQGTFYILLEKLVFARDIPAQRDDSRPITHINLNSNPTRGCTTTWTCMFIFHVWFGE